MKLALGTAQFGMRYGAFNRTGQPADSSVGDILAQARAAGVDLIDTASAYGDSEAVLGALDAQASFAIVTKIAALPDIDPVAAVHASFEQSLQRLGATRVHGLMLHRASDLAGDQGPAIWRAMEGLRDSGRVLKIGFSAYRPEEALDLLRRYPVQIIQVPANIFDRRHRDAGTLDLCGQSGVEVHIRSAFLQGFALADPDQLSGSLVAWGPLLRRFQARCESLGVTPLEGALRYAIGLPGVDRVIVGVDTQGQFRQVLAAADGGALPLANWDGLGTDERGLIEPMHWQGHDPA